MNSKLLFACLIVSIFCVNAEAQRFLPFVKSKSSITPDSVQLTERSGPWLIMCASFSGNSGKEQAFRLAKELRESYRVQAYVYTHKIDVAKQVQGKGIGLQQGNEQNPIPVQIKMKPAKDSRLEEIAVLIGDYSSIEDSKAQKALAGIKAIHPKTMANYDIDPDNKTKGPLKAAFLIPNPLLPKEYFEARKTDAEVLRWPVNAQKYSLLKNSGTYSVRIASFKGSSSFQLDRIKETEIQEGWLKRKGKAKSQSKLMQGSKKATVLAATLRKLGIEAYEFHDRHESYVCVGGFDWIAREGKNGNRENNPEVLAVINKFKGEMVNAGARQAMKTYRLPDKLVQAGIACDVQPIPVLNPKPPTTFTASKKLFGRR